MPKKIAHIDKRELKTKYEELKSQKKVAEYFGCSPQTIGNKLREYGLIIKSNLRNTSNYIGRIKNKIINCLNLYECALPSQILDFIDVDDARYIINPLRELLEEKLITKTIYRGFTFFSLPGKELEVKRKVRIIKMFIEECVKNYGPMKAKPLTKRIKNQYGYNVNRLMIYRLVKELVSDGKLDFVRVALNNIYFIKDDKSQELKAKEIVKSYYYKKRSSKLEKLCNEFFDELDKEFEFTDIEREKRGYILDQITPFLDFDCLGRSYIDLIRTLSILLIKREIFNLKKANSDFNLIIPLLRLHDIIEKRNNEFFHGFHYKSYKYFIKEILNRNDFCEKAFKNKILNSPEIDLRIQYVLTQLFSFDEINTKKIISLYEDVVNRGYNISGKSFKGFLGGLIYLFSKKHNLRLTQNSIAKILDITEVTIRTRKKEIVDVLNKMSPSRIIETETSLKKEIKSHEKTENQYIYLENDEPFENNEFKKNNSGILYSPKTFFENKIKIAFTPNENGLYQSICGISYLKRSNLLNHYLKCPECSNQLILKRYDGLINCICGKVYKYSYQFSNHIIQCKNFYSYVIGIINGKIAKEDIKFEYENEKSIYNHSLSEKKISEGIYDNLSDFDKIWTYFKESLPPGSIIYTLKTNKPNEIVKYGDIGITVKTESTPKIITKDLIQKAWMNLVQDGILFHEDYEKSTYRSSFMLSLFSYLDFVEISSEGPLSVKINFM